MLKRWQKSSLRKQNLFPNQIRNTYSIKKISQTVIQQLEIHGLDVTNCPCKTVEHYLRAQNVVWVIFSIPLFLYHKPCY